MTLYEQHEAARVDRNRRKFKKLSDHDEEIYMQLVELTQNNPLEKILVANDRKYYVVWDGNKFLENAPIDNISNKLIAREPEEVTHIFRYGEGYFWTHMTGFSIKDNSNVQNISENEVDYNEIKCSGRRAKLYVWNMVIHGTFYPCNISKESLPSNMYMYYMKRNTDIFTREANRFIAITKEKPLDFGGMFVVDNKEYDNIIFGNDTETEFSDDSMCNFVLA